jgi:hypothetical protein
MAKGSVTTTWPSTIVSMESGMARKAKKIRSATPIRKWGMIIGSSTSSMLARLKPKPQRTSGNAAMVPSVVEITVVDSAIARLAESASRMTKS